MALMMALIMTKTIEKEEINIDDMNENDVIISHRKRRNIKRERKESSRKRRKHSSGRHDSD